MHDIAKDFLPIPLLIDNQAAELFSGKPMINEKTKHIDIAYHYVRQKINAGYFVTKHVATEFNFADLFTKALTGERSQWLGKAILGMISISKSG